jgi:hypothetical protein
MLNVGLIPAFPLTQDVIEKFWQLLDERFSVDKAKVKQTREFLIQHQVQIAHENSLGQCTNGHSCKNGSKAVLERIIASGNTIDKSTPHLISSHHSTDK